MAVNKQDNELKVFGFLTSQMRMGLITFFYALLITSNIYLYKDNKQLQTQITTMQIEWKNEVIREVKAQIQPLQQQVQTATKEVISTSKNVDSLLTQKGGNK